ncbi:MAG: S9 family peptidase [Gammaproteobacteria bacterium]|nr:S9 family peptidase [Gammaproteobacteria bacterium]
MTRLLSTCTACLFTSFVASASVLAADAGVERFEPMEVFDLEYASDPQIAPDGENIVYVRNFMDIMEDRRRANLWIVAAGGSGHRPLTTGNHGHTSPRWSPDGARLLFVSDAGDSPQIFVRWMDTGQTAKLTALNEAPSGMAWSPDGEWIAFAMQVPKDSAPLVERPSKPEGAEWAKPPKLIDDLVYRADGEGYLEDGFQHIFVLPAEGGTPRQLTSGDKDHNGDIDWSPNGETLYVSANRHDDWQYDPLNTEIYAIDLESGAIQALTERRGPDLNPVVAPDGQRIAYLGFDDRQQGYQVTQLYLMNRDGSDSRAIAAQLDRDVQNPRWDARGRGLYIQYDDEGTTRIGYVTLDGEVQTLAANVGGTSIDRPYSSGSYSVAGDRLAYTLTDPTHPADVATSTRRNPDPERLTSLNDDLLAHKTLGAVEEVRFASSHDDLPLEGWIVKPPGFDAQKKYPLILEIHGGPFANYGPRFAVEPQLYAADGYVVLYMNPRGSTSYGGKFGNLIHHNYPGEDYDDLMSGVDAVLARGYVDADELFVTGGSGGGVLTSWIIGKTDRFNAAVVAKPVINWYSFVLTADLYNFFYKYWFAGFPWDHPEEYLRRSPISLVGNVETPTMILTGESDYRTPISESEQYYQALKLRKIDTVLVRLPGAGHGIANRPSQLMAKVRYILAWFDKHRPD